MAYDWSGNTVKQKRDDWMVIFALVALALFITVTPLTLLMRTSPQVGLIETTAIGTNAAHLKL